MSNEVSTPKVVICPADSLPNHGTTGTNFGTFGGGSPGDFSAISPHGRVSFFVTGDASETDPQLTLIGDDNMGPQTPFVANSPGPCPTASRLAVNAQLAYSLTPATAPFAIQTIAWTTDTHNKVGNVCLADGSVQQNSITGLRNQFQNSTNTVVTPCSTFVQ
jgi:prepilin-type processing-associated H-X9-DG protein